MRIIFIVGCFGMLLADNIWNGSKYSVAAIEMIDNASHADRELASKLGRMRNYVMSKL